MSAWVNLAAISVNAGSGDTSRRATDAQVGAVAGWLGKQIQEMLITRLGLQVGPERLRDLRLQFLNDVLPTNAFLPGDGLIISTKQISFGDASAVLDWLATDSAADDMVAWLGEQELPYTEEMF